MRVGYNPGQNSWDRKAINRKNEVFSSFPLPPMQCWRQAFKSFSVDSTLFGGRGHKRNGLLKQHCQPFFKRWIQSLFWRSAFSLLIVITVPWCFGQGCRIHGYRLPSIIKAMWAYFQTRHYFFSWNWGEKMKTTVSVKTITLTYFPLSYCAAFI